MIYDCFPFCDETDLLEIRLRELENVVDVFVIVEAKETFRRTEKSLTLTDNWDRFSGWASQIRYVVIDYYSSNNPWENEIFTRQCMKHGLKDAKPDDIIIVSDCDEIPRASVIENWDYPTPTKLEQKEYFYYLDLYSTQMQGTTVCRFKDYTDGQTVRRLGGSVPYIPDAGWHFAYLGGADRISRKIQGFAHSELDVPEFTDVRKIQERMNDYRDPFDRSSFTPVEIDDTYPQWVVENQKDLKHLMRPR